MNTDKQKRTPKLWGSVWAYRIVLGLFVCGFLAGIGIMLHPFAQRLLFTIKSIRQAERYQQTVDPANPEIEREYLEAQEYNRKHTTNVIYDPFSANSNEEKKRSEYFSLMNPMGNDMMGVLEIPKIHQRLCIYHGTDEDTLLRGIGHVPGSSLPVGGESAHCVLTGHRGLAAATLLTDLDQMTYGDMFFLHVLGRDLAYEVDQILTVLPSETDALEIVPGEDLVTLVTCTPYAVNSHRLLVRGHRVPYEPPKPTLLADALHWLTPLKLAVITLLLAAVIVLIIKLRKKKRRSHTERTK